MYYPLNLLSQQLVIFPLFKDYLQGDPYIFDLSSSNDRVTEYRTDDFDAFQQQMFCELKQAACHWGVAPYLEERKTLLRNFPQMIEEKRYYHVGLDIVVPYGVSLYAPLPAVVFKVGLDGGVGNYGGYIILKHELNGVAFYSFYGHLDSKYKVCEGDVLAAGQVFATIGEKADSGYWFTHTHLQILTEQAVQQGRLTQGYITQADVLCVDKLFPSPYFLFKW